MSCQQQFIQQLHTHGLRLTPQREFVLDALHKIEGFGTADDIYAQVRQRSSSVDISTVYRTLELLEQFGLVARLDDESGQRRYELLGIHGLHHHLRCTQCGQVIPVPHEELAPLLAHIEEAYGFSVAPTSWTFNGLCSACRAKLDS